jgi:hypothetical protein
MEIDARFGDGLRYGEGVQSAMRLELLHANTGRPGWCAEKAQIDRSLEGYIQPRHSPDGYHILG